MLTRTNYFFYIFNLLACLYKYTESNCCHFDVVVGMGMGIMLSSQSFLCDGQGTVRQAILYVDRSCFKIILFVAFC